MTEEPLPDDKHVLQRLRQRAQRLEHLEQTLSDIEKERKRLHSITSELSEKIKSYEQAKYEWDWFFDNSLDMLCIAGPDGYFKRVNPAFCKALGYEAHTLLSAPITSFVHRDDVEKTGQEIEHLLAGQDSVNFENRYRDSKGQWRWLSWRCPARTSATQNFYAIARDITTEKLRESEILYQAQHDHLTGLLNRAAFEQVLSEAVGRVDRGLSAHLVVLLFDLDHFKPINDLHGHAAGDALLRELGERLKHIQRQHEYIARIGGDEFAWLTETPEFVEEVTPLAKRLLQTILEPVTWRQTELQVGCSIGIAEYPRQTQNPEEIMLEADKALYAAKRKGRGQFVRAGAQD